MRFEFDQDESCKSTSDIQTAKRIFSEANSLLEGVYEWVKVGGRMTISYADNDTSKVYLFLSQKELDSWKTYQVGSVPVEWQTIKDEGLLTEPITSSIAESEMKAFREKSFDYALPERFFIRRNKQFGVTWHDEICTSCVDRKNALIIALQYATAEGGSASLQQYSECELEEFAEGDIEKLKYVYDLHLNFTDPLSLNQWGECLAVLAK